MIDNHEVPEEGVKYINIVRDIAEIMIKHYDYYCDEIWKLEEQRITSYILEVSTLFANRLIRGTTEPQISRLFVLREESYENNRHLTKSLHSTRDYPVMMS